MAQPSLSRLFIEGLFSLKGRLRRSDFWGISIALSIVAVLLGIALSSILRFVVADAPIWLMPLLTQAVIAWPAYAVSVKRGHDRDRSAWWTLWVNVAFHAVPMGLMMINQPQGAFWVYAVIGVYVLVEYGLLEGTKGPNRFGPSPKGEHMSV